MSAVTRNGETIIYKSVTQSISYQRLQALLNGLGKIPPAQPGENMENINMRATTTRNLFQQIREMQDSDASHSRCAKRPSS